MSAIETGAHSIGNRSSRTQRRSFKTSTRIDMTPMVDLAFLLLTFFVLTATFSKPAAIELNMPVKGDPTGVKNTLTLLVNKSDTVFYYSGMLNAGPANEIQTTGYGANGIRKLLLEYNKQNESNESTGQNPATVLLKALDGARYERVIDLLDELRIVNVKRYALCDPLADEYEAIKVFSEKK